MHGRGDRSITNSHTASEKQKERYKRRINGFFPFVGQCLFFPLLRKLSPGQANKQTKQNKPSKKKKTDINRKKKKINKKESGPAQSGSWQTSNSSTIGCCVVFVYAISIEWVVLRRTWGVLCLCVGRSCHSQNHSLSVLIKSQTSCYSLVNLNEAIYYWKFYRIH